LSLEWSTWLNALPTFTGLLAAGVRSPDQASYSRGYVEGFQEGALANAWRCVDDTFRVMRLHRFPTQQLRWVYDNAVLTAVRREDGRLLLVFTEPDLPREGEAGLNAWIQAFLSGSRQVDVPPKSSNRAARHMPGSEEQQ
jgi:hypothetical protein